MYDNRHGRFTAVDPLLASGMSANPQTFNRYVYVANNPIVLTDPSGMFIEAWTYGGLLWGWSTQNFDNPFQAPVVEGESGPANDSGVHSSAGPLSGSPPDDCEGLVCYNPVSDPHEFDGFRVVRMSPAEREMNRMFGSPGYYFSIPTDGDLYDATIDISRPPEGHHNHMYPSANDPNARGNVYIPADATYLGVVMVTDGGGERMPVVLLHFRKFGKLEDVTLSIWHLVNVKLGPVESDGRRKIGEFGFGAGGTWSYKRVSNAPGRSGYPRAMTPDGTHLHFELYQGRKTRIIKGQKDLIDLYRAF